MKAQIHGRIEHITYLNEETGYTVLKVKIPEHKEPITVVGRFISAVPGENLEMEGKWILHPQYGHQFLCERYETLVPATTEGIRRYLGSGLIKGIGPVMAERIVQHFGSKTLDIIDREADRLLQVEGIGPYRLTQIRNAWEEQKAIREVMVFLHSHGVSSSYAARIFKHYGDSSISILQENPYQVAMDVPGIGFITADRIAQKLGFPKDSPLRAEAAILYSLFKAAEDGHMCLPRNRLMEQCNSKLDIPLEILKEALAKLVDKGKIIQQQLPDGITSSFGDSIAIYVQGYHLAEVQTAQRLIQLQDLKILRQNVNAERILTWLNSHLPFRLEALQLEAVVKCLTENVVIITGGPGTGKTTLIKAVLVLSKKLGARLSLAAPTGRAAKRLNETTGHPAMTLHRLLEYSPQQGGFQRNQERPLSADIVIIDEASMLDNLLMYHLLKAIPPRATLILVGDVDQLPSVGPGCVLEEMIASGRFPVVRLTHIFRQAQKSQIVLNAHRILKGRFPYIKAGKNQDFYFIEQDEPERALEIVLRLCKERIPERFGFDPMEEIQVLSPMQRGVVGVQRLNTELQKALNPEGISIERAGRLFRLHDKVMQIRNNYDKEVFNGDMGRIRRIDLENQKLQVETDGRLITYEFSELDDLTLAYAVSVHKAQGSEYPAVVIPLLTQHFVMLQRTLIYTAITRARRLVVIVGSKKALAIAVRNNKTQRRFTLLKERLTSRI